MTFRSRSRCQAGYSRASHVENFDDSRGGERQPEISPVSGGMAGGRALITKPLARCIACSWENFIGCGLRMHHPGFWHVGICNISPIPSDPQLYTGLGQNNLPRFSEYKVKELRFSASVAGRKAQLFQLIFTQPGKVIFVHVSTRCTMRNDALFILI